MTPEKCDENTQPNLGLWRNGKLNTGKKSFRNSCWNAVWEIEIQTDTHHRRSITLNEKLKLDYFFLLTLFFNSASRLYIIMNQLSAKEWMVLQTRSLLELFSWHFWLFVSEVFPLAHLDTLLRKAMVRLSSEKLAFER